MKRGRENTRRPTLLAVAALATVLAFAPAARGEQVTLKGR